MCRSITQLRRPSRDVTPVEIEAAARQFVRKISGYRQPSRANAAAFEAAIAEISGATERLLAALDALPATAGTGAHVEAGPQEAAA